MASLKHFCGLQNGSKFAIWDEQSKLFGDCFQWICFTASSHFIFATVCAFLIGISRAKPIQSHRRSQLGVISLVLCYLHALSPIVAVALSYILKESNPPPAFVLAKSLTFSSWLVCIILQHRTLSIRKRLKFFCTRQLLACMIILASSSVQLYDHIKRSTLKTSAESFPYSVSDWFSLIYFILNFLFIFIILAILCSRGRYTTFGRVLPSLVSTGIQSPDEEFKHGHHREEDALLGTHFDSYDSYTSNNPCFSEDTPLGWAEEDASCLSKIIFWWVNPMMKKGSRNKLQKAEDLFFLPLSLDTKMIKEIFQSILRLQKLNSHSSFKHSTNLRDMKRRATLEGGEEAVRRPLLVSLFKALNRAFGIFYYSIGIFKFLADCLAFAGPILLNLLVSFMENKKEPIEHGYYYAFGLLSSTLLAALLSAQYNYQVNKVRLQCRAALITTVYEKSLAVSSTSLSAFSTGQVINFMSTDTDRVINFCNSFHEFWSLPFQIAVSLYLLYQQVGLAFLAGLGFAILLIPVNRWIAIKIMDLSKKMMEQKDKRIKLMNECLFGMRFIKFCAWEDNFSQKIEMLRKAELSSLRGRKYLDALCVYFWATTPVLISILTFATYVLMGHELTAAKVFTSIALFSILIAPLNAFPWVINGLLESWVSVKRIETFLTLQEINLDDYYTRILEDSDYTVLEIEDGNFRWKGWQPPNKSEKQKDESRSKEKNTEYDIVQEPFCLQDINVRIKKGDLVGIIGKVGSGKSSFLAALTAEMERQEGKVFAEDYLDGFGYTSQDSWIQHATIRDNILSGRPFYQEIYNHVIHCCALEEDLALFTAGDLTEVGENGITLSGGQKARVALARAVYQDKDIYLLDDPLAAVDAHVAQHIFTKCIMGLLEQKTRILCTHHTKYLWDADYIIVFEDGRIVKSGVPEDILSRDKDVMFEVNQPEEKDDSENSVEDNPEELKKAEENKDEGILIQEEERKQGVVSFSVYKSYWKAVGHILSFSIMLFLLFMQGSRNISDWWLAYWISNEKEKKSSVLQPVHNSSSTEFHKNVHVSQDVEFYLTVYGSIAGANTVFTLFRAFLFAYGGVEAAKIIHKRLLKSILRAPISFFDVTPIGRIMNRFSSDLYSIDDSLPFMLNIFLAQVFGVIGTIIVTCYGIPWFAAVLVPLGAVYIYTQNFYRKTSRELKRISTVTLSPIYEHFSETLSGLPTIRALRETARFSEDNETKLDASQRANFSGIVASQWLMLRLQLIGVAMVTAVSFLAVVEHHVNTVDPGLVGLAIAYALSATGRLNGLVTSFTETEKEMVSVERASQYIEGAPQEDNGKTRGVDVDDHWPEMGGISFRNVKLIYRPGLPPALNNISMYIKAGEKIGICGRTGSGKSSLLLVLFRMVPIETGAVIIDGLDTSTISLKTLRSRMSIIPQDPFLFNGSIRENIDPFGVHSEIEIMHVLKRCHLQKAVTEMGGLESTVGEKGQNLSAGQRQLACLARALLKRSKIICIDEATASVDLETDKLIQKTIREEFKHSTVLTIAHRIETILDNDRILVMDKGRITELDSPKSLLSNSGSLFYSMLHRKHFNC